MTTQDSIPAITTKINTKMQQQYNSINYKMCRKTSKMTSVKSEEEYSKPKPIMIKMNKQDAQTFIENDRENYQKQKLSWKRMDKTIQWKYIMDYLKMQLAEEVEDDVVVSVKRLFLDNHLSVEYDASTDAVLKLNTILKLEKPPKEIPL